ncbi:MAG: hypothetical protein DME46_03255 [Verrucomicrobia bacterium]|nr:MAG: hypothetical protein DME46_03255 [Verrucomicrobiota bacterium]
MFFVFSAKGAKQTTEKMSVGPTARMAMLQLSKNLARRRLQTENIGSLTVMDKCDPFALPKMIVPGQVNQSR